MKYCKKIFFSHTIVMIAAIGFIMIGCSNQSMPSAGQPQIISAIDSGRWVFVPSQVVPQNGRSQQVNGSSYTATLKDGKFDVYLPYYGRAYGGIDVLNGRSPLFFTSSNFSIVKEEKSTGKWAITIKPRDYNNVQSMHFSIFNNGRANVDVVLTNRSAISFNGAIGPVK